MKKGFYFLSVAICLFSLVACGEKDSSSIRVTAVELNKDQLTLAEGASATLAARITPDNATDKTVAWKSSVTAVATVDQNGRVIAVAVGQATITATANDGSGSSDECVVTVTEAAAIPVTAVELNKATLGLMEGEDETLTARITPDDATDKTVEWKSSDTAVATVDQTGKVTAVTLGKATITVTANDGSGSSDECEVSVVDDLMGEVSFKTENTWTVGGKIWSDAVMAQRCRKEDFDGGAYGQGVYKIDCRKNEFPGDDYNPPAVYGDFFSWEAVNTYGAILCPYPWRTPAAQDFVDLDIALGGDGSNNEMLSGRIQLYLSEWGGEFGGYCWVDPTSGTNTLVVQSQTDYACYWAGESVSRANAASLGFGTPRGFISPAGQSEKTNGYTLRCVK